MEFLFSGDFDQYVRANSDHHRVLWFFLHIPKTAGTSLWRELSYAKQPALNIIVERHSEEDAEVSRTQALAHLFAEVAREPKRVCRAHFGYESLLPLRALVDELRFITMLREPVARVISEFRYGRSPARALHQEIIQRYPTVEDYVYARENRNKIYNHLRQYRGERVSEVITRVTREFAFVGITELYALSRNVLFRLMDVTPGAVPHARPTESVPENQVTLTSDLRSRIEKLNARDMELYTHFASRWAQQRPSIEHWLALPEQPKA